MSGIDGFTKLITHCDGADTSTTFTDDSDSAHTVTPFATAQVDTAQSVFGGASCLLDGNSDYLQISDSDDFNFGTGDFTIDFRVRFNTITGFHFFYHQGTTADRVTFFKDAGHALQFRVDVGSSEVANFETASGVVTTNTWYHIALVRQGASEFIFVDGVQKTLFYTTNPDATAVYPDRSENVWIGKNEFGNYLNGWIDEYRVSKGVARWTTNFTPPTAPYSREISNSIFFGSSF